MFTSADEPLSFPLLAAAARAHPSHGRGGSPRLRVAERSLSRLQHPGTLDAAETLKPERARVPLPVMAKPCSAWTRGGAEVGECATGEGAVKRRSTGWRKLPVDAPTSSPHPARQAFGLARDRPRQGEGEEKARAFVGIAKMRQSLCGRRLREAHALVESFRSGVMTSLACCRRSSLPVMTKPCSAWTRGGARVGRVMGEGAVKSRRTGWRGLPVDAPTSSPHPARQAFGLARDRPRQGEGEEGARAFVGIAKMRQGSLPLAGRGRGGGMRRNGRRF